jgi:hypothetical protein
MLLHRIVDHLDLYWVAMRRMHLLLVAITTDMARPEAFSHGLLPLALSVTSIV